MNNVYFSNEGMTSTTANYYANASVYSRHADTNKYYYDAFEDKTTNND